jgi:hypothetical protein
VCGGADIIMEVEMLKIMYSILMAVSAVGIVLSMFVVNLEAIKTFAAFGLLSIILLEVEDIKTTLTAQERSDE